MISVVETHLAAGSHDTAMIKNRCHHALLENWTC